MRRILIVLALATSCAGEDPDPPTECDRSDRRGTYLVQYSERDGNCGPLPDELVILPADADATSEAGCRIDNEQWSRGDCRYDADVSCSDGSGFVGYAVAQDETASRLEGRVTLTGLNCRSTYDVTWTRE